MFYFKSFLLTLLAFILFTGCAQKTATKPNISKADLQKVDWKDIEGFGQDDLDLGLQTFQKDCKVSRKYKNLSDICEKSDDALDPNKFFMTHFTPYKLLSGEEDTGLITGYYEPILQGSLKKTKKYKYPIYTVPKDLLTLDLTPAYPELKKYKLRGKLIGNMVIPYDTRAAIEDSNNKDNENLTPICFVDDKIDLFFMHIQGSGKVQLRDGSILNVGYAQQNGRSYYAIGRKLIEMKAIKKEDISLQSIRTWLKRNPSQIDSILNLNESYIFFQQSDKTATGSLGTELTANRNLAVDREFIPLGFPVFINTTNPINQKPINQLMVAADTGGAIKGKIRADFFFGNGKLAEKLAGRMKQKGKLYILIPNNIIKEEK
jgi:membrane-bound lytic murein transglycosylase A